MSVDAPEVVDDDLPRLGEVLGGRAHAAPPSHDTAAAPESAPPAAAMPPLRAELVAAAGFLSSAAAGVLAGGVFTGGLPRAVGVLGAAIGAAMVWASTRSRRTGLIQLLTIPVAAVVGAALAVTGTGRGANLPGLVLEALRAGGISQPPVPFDPGWRFLLLVGTVMVAGASTALALALNRAKVAAFLPVPVLFGALLAQPRGAGLALTLVALVLFATAVAASFGAELASEGALTAGFELRRMGRAAGAVAGLLVLLLGATQVGFLYPDPRADEVIPPRRPTPSPPQTDRVLFAVESDEQVPWRMGVLDVYDGRAWLTPPLDPRRLEDVPPSGRIASGPSEADTTKAEFTVADLGGHTLPVIANVRRVRTGGAAIQYDPRTQTIRLTEGRPERGLTYTVEANASPTAADLASSPPPSDEMDEFLQVPAPPAAVEEILAGAPAGADAFSRLQHVRDRLYAEVVAEGEGEPEDVPPRRVVEMLAGKPATPFEITAAEALLARWAGVPSRVGYGYYDGDDAGARRTELRPRHGAMWLEVHFEGFGWVPIVGTPPRAQSSLSEADKRRDPTVRPSDRLTLPVYVPVRLPTIQLLYVLVQFWVTRVVSYLVIVGLIGWLYAGVVKAVRGARRRRWAQREGLAARLRVAYASFRDTAHDFNIGHAALTPLEFAHRTEPDREHQELAWLVTRALWGDLARDLRVADVETAEEMARSMSTRIRAVQPFPTRVLAFASRRSLRDPYTDDIPNLWWPSPSLRSRAAARLRSAARRVTGAASSALLRRRPATAAALLLVVLTLGGCVRDIEVAGSPSQALPERLVPETLRDLRFQREPSTEATFDEAGDVSLVGDARVFSVHRGDEVVGSLQVAAFKKATSTRDREVRNGVISALGGGRFETRRVGDEVVYSARQPDRQIFLWFGEGNRYYELLIAKTDLEDAADVFVELLAFQRGEPARRPVPTLPDPRRGHDG